MTIQMQFLLKLSYTQQYEDTPLFCSNEIQPLLEKILKSGIQDFNFTTPLGGTLVHICAANSLVNILIYINTFCVTNNLNLNLIIGNRRTGKTPIAIAAEQGNLELISFFLETVKNNDLLLKKGDNLDKLPVHFAASGLANTEIKNQLIEKLDPTNTLRNTSDFTGITAQDILDNPLFSFPGTEACPVLRDSLGRTQFMVNIFRANLMGLQEELESYETRREREALVNATDYYGYSALIYACMIGSEDVIKLLLWHADVNQSDNRENYPLHFAVLNAYKVQHKNKAIVIELLIEKHAGNYPNAQGLTPIDFAAMIGQIGLQKFIIENIKCSPKRLVLEKPLPTLTKSFDQMCLSSSKSTPIFCGFSTRFLPKLS